MVEESANNRLGQKGKREAGTRQRIGCVDSLRGFTLCSMIAYHMAWDMEYLYHFNLSWMHTGFAYVWQQSICWSFILISGFCWSMGSRPVKKGFQVFLLGLLISVVTLTLVPEAAVLFGILTFMGSVMLILAGTEGLLIKIHPVAGNIGSFILFLACRGIRDHFIGFPGMHLSLPDFLYRNYFTAYLGFPFKGFSSSDYFGILPWFFLYLTGYYLHKIYERYFKVKDSIEWKEGIFSHIGKYSLWIYMIHQPVLYGMASLLHYLFH